VLNWRALNYEVKGYVVIKPLVWAWGLPTRAL
jgi:hypothetical protein